RDFEFARGRDAELVAMAAMISLHDPVQPPHAPALIGKHSSGIRLSVEEFRQLHPQDVDENYRYEIVQGVLIVTPPPDIAERDPNEELGHLLRTYQRSHPQGTTLDL